MTSTTDNASVVRITREARGRVAGDGVELAFGYWPGRGAPVIALHGLTASYVNFIGIAECLAGRLPLLGFDLRGRGDSGKPNGPYGMAQHARDVAAAMRGMGLGPNIVIGHSMGAYVATALAMQNPELVSGLVLIDGGYMPARPATLDPTQGAYAALAARIAQLNTTYPSREDYRKFWRSQPNFPAHEWNRWVEAFLDYEVAGETTVKPKASQAGVVVDVGEAIQEEAIVARLKSIRVPTLLLRAERGFVQEYPPLFSDETAEQIRSLLPHLEDHKFPGTTHYTIVLGEKSAAKIADLIYELDQRLRANPGTQSAGA